MKNIIKNLIIISTFILTIGITSILNTYASDTYTVKPGDSLWKISITYNLTVSQLMEYNGLSSTVIYVGQQLKLAPTITTYTVKSGDSLWNISVKFNTTIAKIISLNNLTGNTIYPNQVLKVPNSTTTTKPTPVLYWPSQTYIVKDGDFISVIASKFGVSQADIIKYNYLQPDEWLNVGQKIAINGYAPRNYTVMPGESSSPTHTGKLVDWFLDGQYLLNRNDTLLITDSQTGLQFKVKIMGGYNHADVEPLTAADTATMHKLFPTWNWAPRSVVIFFNGINFAASISGMPHSFDTIPGNNVTGHFDLYLKNSTSHGVDTSTEYIQQHQANILTAAGR